MVARTLASNLRLKDALLQIYPLICFTVKSSRGKPSTPSVSSYGPRSKDQCRAAGLQAAGVASLEPFPSALPSPKAACTPFSHGCSDH